jgi:hypothetical protein
MAFTFEMLGEVAEVKVLLKQVCLKVRHWYHTVRPLTLYLCTASVVSSAASALVHPSTSPSFCSHCRRSSGAVRRRLSLLVSHSFSNFSSTCPPVDCQHTNELARIIRPLILCNPKSKSVHPPIKRALTSAQSILSAIIAFARRSSVLRCASCSSLCPSCCPPSVLAVPPFFSRLVTYEASNRSAESNPSSTRFWRTSSMMGSKALRSAF